MWRAILAPVSSFHLLHPVEVKMDGPLASKHHIQPLCILLSPFGSLEVNLSRAGYQPAAALAENSLCLSAS